MQFVCVTFFYISVFYRYKEHLHTKHTIKTPIFHPHAHTHTNERTPLCIPRTSPTYDTHFHPLQHHIKRGLSLFAYKTPAPKRYYIQ